MKIKSILKHGFLLLLGVSLLQACAQKDPGGDGNGDGGDGGDGGNDLGRLSGTMLFQGIGIANTLTAGTEDAPLYVDTSNGFTPTTDLGWTVKEFDYTNNNNQAKPTKLELFVKKSAVTKSGISKVQSKDFDCTTSNNCDTAIDITSVLSPNFVPGNDLDTQRITFDTNFFEDRFLYVFSLLVTFDDAKQETLKGAIQIGGTNGGGNGGNSFVGNLYVGLEGSANLVELQQNAITFPSSELGSGSQIYLQLKDLDFDGNTVVTIALTLDKVTPKNSAGELSQESISRSYRITSVGDIVCTDPSINPGIGQSCGLTNSNGDLLPIIQNIGAGVTDSEIYALKYETGPGFSTGTYHIEISFSYGGAGATGGKIEGDFIIA